MREESRTIDLESLSEILDRSRTLFTQALELEALDQTSLERAARDLHARIKALVDLADQSGVISKTFMQKSGVWIDKPEVRTRKTDDGFVATIRHGREAEGRLRDRKPNDVRGDFSAAVHHVFRYAHHVLNRGQPKHYGRIEESSGNPWQQAVLE